MKRLANISVILLPFALFLMGCGGGGDAAPSKAEFDKQAIAICKKAESAIRTTIQTYVREHPEFLTLQPEIGKDRKILALSRPILEKRFEELSGLTPPDGGEKKVNAIIAESKAAVKRAAENPHATIGGTYRHVDQLAGEYGIPECEIF